jgi:hypothetical protein
MLAEVSTTNIRSLGLLSWVRGVSKTERHNRIPAETFFINACFSKV